MLIRMHGWASMPACRRAGTRAGKPASMHQPAGTLLEHTSLMIVPHVSQRHTQVFASFIKGFGPAYRPLLTAIRQRYDSAVQQGVQCALVNLELRRQLLASCQQQRQAVRAERARVMDGENALRSQYTFSDCQVPTSCISVQLGR